MLDFPMHQSSVWTSLYCLFFYLLILLRYGIKSPYSVPLSTSRKNWALFVMAFFLITHCMKGDFFHMMHYVYDYSQDYESNFGEEIYSHIGLFVNKNYFLFRTIVWGGAFVLFCSTAKRLNISVYYAALLLLLTHSVVFAYARATAAMAVYFFGLSFLCKPLHRRWLSYAIAIILIVVSMAFHKSAVIMVVMTIMIFVPIRKWSVILLLLLLPALSMLFNKLLMVITMMETTDSAMAGKIEMYSERELVPGISGYLINTLEYASFYVPAILTSLCLLLKNRISYVSVDLLRMYKVTIGLVLVSVIFFLMGSSYVTFGYRILYMSMIPMTLVVVQLYQCNMMSRQFYLYCVYTGLSFMCVKYFYTVYVHIVNPNASDLVL